MPLDEHTPHHSQLPHNWLLHTLASEGILARPTLVLVFSTTSIFFSVCAAAKYWGECLCVCVLTALICVSGVCVGCLCVYELGTEVVCQLCMLWLYVLVVCVCVCVCVVVVVVEWGC